MGIIETLFKKFWGHKWLWLYGMIVLFGLVTLSFTKGMRGFFSYWVFSPNLWPPYIFAPHDVVEAGTPLAFTFHLFSHFAPWEISVWAFVATVVYWIATAFVVSTTVAAICGGLHLKHKRLVLWIDVVIVLLFIVYLGYADSFIVRIPHRDGLSVVRNWSYDILSITLSVLTLWVLLIAMGHRPPFLGLGRRKVYVTTAVLAAIACLGIIAYYDSNSIRFSAIFLSSLRTWTWIFIAAVWLLMVIWLLCETKRKISFKLNVLIPHLCAFGVVVALALTVGSPSISVFGEKVTVLIRVLWLPHFNIAELNSLQANQFDLLHSYEGLLAGWNIISFIFTLMWWAIITRILVVLGKQLYAAVIGPKEADGKLQPAVVPDNEETPEA